MSALVTISPALPPAIACAVALGCLWVGIKSLRTGSPSPLFRPMVQLNLLLMEMAEREEAERRRKAPLLTAETIKVYAWGFIYAGVFALIVAGGQLVRLLAGGLG